MGQKTCYLIFLLLPQHFLLTIWVRVWLGLWNCRDCSRQIHDLLSTRLIVNQVYHFQVSYITDYVGKMIQNDSIDLNKKYYCFEYNQQTSPMKNQITPTFRHNFIQMFIKKIVRTQTDHLPRKKKEIILLERQGKEDLLLVTKDHCCFKESRSRLWVILPVSSTMRTLPLKVEIWA